jgi:hypothetical protein
VRVWPKAAAEKPTTRRAVRMLRIGLGVYMELFLVEVVLLETLARLTNCQ